MNSIKEKVVNFIESLSDLTVLGLFTYIIVLAPIIIISTAIPLLHIIIAATQSLVLVLAFLSGRLFTLKAQNGWKEVKKLWL